MKKKDKLIHFDEINSTNEYAMQIAGQSPEFTTVIADVQRKGKGRFGRTWVSPPGGIWMSIILKPKGQSPHPMLLTLLTGLAVVRGLKTSGISASLKWPNDVLVDSRKIAGILLEGDPLSNSVIVGIGVNANFGVDALPEDLSLTATTVRNELKRAVNKKLLTEDIIAELKSVYEKFEKGETSELLSEWKRYSNTIGQDVAVDMITEVAQGKIVDIDEDGSLILADQDGNRRKIIAGEVRLKT